MVLRLIHSAASWTAPVASFPDATNTGTSGALTAVPGTLTSGSGWSWNASPPFVNVTGNGANLSNLDINGGIYSNTNVTNVTINNCKCRWCWPQPGSDGWSIRDCDVGYPTPVELSLIWFTDADNGTVLRCNIHGGENGVYISGSNTLVQDNFIHDMWPSGSVGGAHVDGVQVDNISCTIEHNTIIGPVTGGNSCITMTGTSTNVIINNNRLRSSNYLVYFCYHASNQLTNNRMAEAGSGYWVNTTPPGTGSPTISGNVNDDTGAPV